MFPSEGLMMVSWVERSEMPSSSVSSTLFREQAGIGELFLAEETSATPSKLSSEFSFLVSLTRVR